MPRTRTDIDDPLVRYLYPGCNVKAKNSRDQILQWYTSRATRWQGLRVSRCATLVTIGPWGSDLTRVGLIGYFALQPQQHHLVTTTTTTNSSEFLSPNSNSGDTTGALRYNTNQGVTNRGKALSRSLVSLCVAQSIRNLISQLPYAKN